MYLPHILDNNTIYFKNTISEPQTLISLIEELDSIKETESFISKWQEINNNISFKKFLKDDKKMTNKQKQKCLYVYNSFYSGINYCKEIYSNTVKKETTKIKPIYLFKSKPLIESIYTQEYSVISSPNTISVYMLLNTEHSGSAFCVDKERSIYIYPEPYTVIMIPDNTVHSEGINQEKSLYFLKTSFELGKERLQCSNLL